MWQKIPVPFVIPDLIEADLDRQDLFEKWHRLKHKDAASGGGMTC